MVSESQIEQKAVKLARAAGWMSFKLNSPGSQGLPDRVFIKEGRIVFIEFKTIGGRLSEIQKAQIRKLRYYGAEVYVIWAVDEALDCLGIKRC